jgi:hypothetical protein
MIMKRILMLATVVLLLALGAGAALAQSGYDLFQKALVKERAVGDVEEALRLYQRIVKEFGGNHALAAKAQLRMGLLYDRLGREAEAQRAFQVIVNQYADQANEAQQARAKIATAAASPRNNNPNAKTATGLTARQIWADNGSNRYAAVSADGRYMTLVPTGAGVASELLVRDLITGTIRRLTNIAERDDAGQDAEYSIISPDSQQVAYTWVTWVTGGRPEGRPDLRIRSATGGEADQPRIVHLADDETAYLALHGWTADGKNLLVVRKVMDNTWQIAFISIANGSIRVLKSLEWQQPIKASLSPDGRYIAYDMPAGDRGSARDIFLLAADGSRQTVVVEHRAEDRTPLWSADGSHLVFVSNRTGKSSLWMVPIDGGRPKGPAVLVKEELGGILPLGITRSGVLYYVLQNQIHSNYRSEVWALENFLPNSGAAR